MVNPLAQLVFIAIDRGRLDVARDRAAQLGELVRSFGSTLPLPMSVWPFVRLAAAEDRPRAALRLAGFAAARERATGLGINELERTRWQPAIDRLRTVLAPGEADGLLVEGAAMAIEQALEEALGGCVATEPAAPSGAVRCRQFLGRGRLGSNQPSCSATSAARRRCRAPWHGGCWPPCWTRCGRLARPEPGCTRMA